MGSTDRLTWLVVLLALFVVMLAALLPDGALDAVIVYQRF